MNNSKKWLVAVIILVLVIVLLFKAFKIRNNNSVELNNEINNGDSMNITSNIFGDNEYIGKAYSCYGESKSISLEISGVPEGTKSLALIVDDPDAPNGDFVHWVLYNIDPNTSEIKTGTIPEGATEGLNSLSKNGYVSPCPPSGTHRYYFKFYALDKTLTQDKNQTKDTVLDEMKGHVIDEAMILGLYKKD